MILKNKIVVFDLDDTLYKEIDFLKSAYKEIMKKVYFDYNILLDYDTMLSDYHKGLNVFNNIIVKHPDITFDYLINIYRNHNPNINIGIEKINCLKKIRKISYKLGIITDGRVITQTNKLKALKIADFFDDVIISEEFGSEKPNVNNFTFFEEKYGVSCNFFFIGDNILKDFITPNKLGWITVGIKDVNSVNIHKQSIKVNKEFLPKFWVNNICELTNLIKENE